MNDQRQRVLLTGGAGSLNRISPKPSCARALG